MVVADEASTVCDGVVRPGSEACPKPREFRRCSAPDVATNSADCFAAEVVFAERIECLPWPVRIPAKASRDPHVVK